MGGNETIHYIAAVVVFHDLLVGYWGDPVVIEFVPPPVLIWLDKSEVMATV